MKKICDKCRFYYQEETSWRDKCLMYGMGLTAEHLKSVVLIFDRCDYFKEIIEPEAKK